MTTQKLPRVSKRATTEALQVLAAEKLVRDTIGAHARNAKAYLAKAMNPGDRLTAVDGEGNEVATVSMSKPRTRGGLTITDSIALANWCDEMGIHHGGKPAVEFPEWFEAKANLEVLVRQAGGELPPGMEDTTEEAPPTITVRQTEAQARNTLAAFTTTRQLIDAGLNQDGDDK